MDKYVEVTLDINGTNRYHFSDISPEFYFETIYLPAHDAGAIIRDITRHEFESHANHEYLVTFNEKLSYYCASFVNERHESDYKFMFNKYMNKKHLSNDNKVHK